MMTLDQERLTLDIVSILERMAFVLCEPAEEETDFELDLDNFSQHVEVTFSGSGKDHLLHLSADNGFLVELSSSLLGLDEDEVEAHDQGLGALLELGNVVSGEIVRLLGGEEIEFDLELPEPTDRSEVEKMEPVGEETYLFCVESNCGLLRVGVHLGI